MPSRKWSRACASGPRPSAWWACPSGDPAWWSAGAASTSSARIPSNLARSPEHVVGAEIGLVLHEVDHRAHQRPVVVVPPDQVIGKPRQGWIAVQGHQQAAVEQGLHVLARLEADADTGDGERDDG